MTKQPLFGMLELVNLFIDYKVIHKKLAALYFNLPVNIVLQGPLMEPVDYGMLEKEHASKPSKVILDKSLILPLMQQVLNLQQQVLIQQPKFTAFHKLLVC